MNCDEYIEKLLKFQNRLVQGYAESLAYYEKGGFTHCKHDFNVMLNESIVNVEFTTKGGKTKKDWVTSCRPILAAFFAANKNKGMLNIIKNPKFLNNATKTPILFTWDLVENDYCQINTSRNWSILGCVRLIENQGELLQEMVQEALKKTK